MALSIGLAGLTKTPTFVLDRPLRAQSAALSGLHRVEGPALSRVEGFLGVEYFKTTGVDIMQSPWLFKWTVDPSWQLRVASVGWLGEVDGYLRYSELHDIKLGGQWQYFDSSIAPFDAALRVYVVGVDTKKQRYILTALWTTYLGETTWDLNAELSVPLQPTAPQLQGMIALGGKGWITPELGWGVGLVSEMPEGLTPQYFWEAAVFFRPSPDWVFDLGGHWLINGPSTNYTINLGMSIAIGSK